MTAKDGGRPAKVAARIQEELAAMLLRGDIHEPDASGVFCSSVRVTSDLSIAHVGVRLFDTEVTEPKKKRVVAALARATGFVRKTIGGRLGLRHAPDIKFHWDTGVDHQNRIEEILEDVRREKKSGGDA
jgi:ribosome-binding factor A